MTIWNQQHWWWKDHKDQIYQMTKFYNMDENEHEPPYYWISSMDLIWWMSSIFWHMHVNFIHVICFIIVITCFSNLTWLTSRKRGIDDNILFLYSTIVKNIILKKHLLSDPWTPIWNNIYDQILWWFFHVIHIFIKLNVCEKSNQIKHNSQYSSEPISKNNIS